MLREAIPLTLGVPVKERDRRQSAIAQFIGQVLMEMEAQLLEQLLESKMSSREEVITAHVEAKCCAQEVLTARKLQEEAEERLAVRLSEEEVTKVKLVAVSQQVAEAEAEVRAAEAKREALLKEQALCNAACSVLQGEDTSAGSSGSVDRKALAAVCKRLDLEDSLLSTLPLILGKPVAARSYLETAASNLICEALRKHLQQMKGQESSPITEDQELQRTLEALRGAQRATEAERAEKLRLAQEAREELKQQEVLLQQKQRTETSAWARLQDAKTGAANAASAACAARATLASGALQRLRRGAASAYEALEGPEMTSNVTQDLQEKITQIDQSNEREAEKRYQQLLHDEPSGSPGSAAAAKRRRWRRQAEDQELPRTGTLVTEQTAAEPPAGSPDEEDVPMEGVSQQDGCAVPNAEQAEEADEVPPDRVHKADEAPNAVADEADDVPAEVNEAADKADDVPVEADEEAADKAVDDTPSEAEEKADDVPVEADEEAADKVVDDTPSEAEEKADDVPVEADEEAADKVDDTPSEAEEKADDVPVEADEEAANKEVEYAPSEAEEKADDVPVEADEEAADKADDIAKADEEADDDVPKEAEDQVGDAPAEAEEAADEDMPKVEQTEEADVDVPTLVYEADEEMPSETGHQAEVEVRNEAQKELEEELEATQVETVEAPTQQSEATTQMDEVPETLSENRSEGEGPTLVVLPHEDIEPTLKTYTLETLDLGQGGQGPELPTLALEPRCDVLDTDESFPSTLPDESRSPCRSPDESRSGQARSPAPGSTREAHSPPSLFGIATMLLGLNGSES
ncbi:unnamed protein product [Durusdinium trenchii]|uniref:Uncharacterized protein n=1 Tax=Durusdinium trenchii TaxID=1381693 RepID=A0ABP0LJ18_9DINO